MDQSGQSLFLVFAEGRNYQFPPVFSCGRWLFSWNYPTAGSYGMLSERLAVPLRQCGSVRARRRGSVSKISLRKRCKTQRDGGGSVKTHRQMLTPASIHTQTHIHTHTQGFYCVGAQCGFQAQKLLSTRPEWSGNCLLTLKYARLNSTTAINPQKAFKCQTWTNVFASPCCCPDTGGFLISFLPLCVFPHTSVLSHESLHVRFISVIQTE